MVGGDLATRRRALEAEYGATFGRTGGGECIGHIPCVRLAPGPRGERSVTVHGASWAEALDALEAIVSDGPGTG